MCPLKMAFNVSEGASASEWIRKTGLDAVIIEFDISMTDPLLFRGKRN